MLKHYSLLLKLLIQWLLFASSLLLSATPAEEEQYSKPNCRSSCGNLKIPYPFGIGKNCSMEGFDITCNTTHNPPRAFLSATEFEVVNISIDQNQLHIKNSINVTLLHIEELSEPERYSSFNLKHTPFALSHKNKFTVTGCNSKGWVQFGARAEGVNFDCYNLCFGGSDFTENNNTYGPCFGEEGCCEMRTFKGIKVVNTSVKPYYRNESTLKEECNISTISTSYHCGSAFLADDYKFSYDQSYLDDCLSPHIRDSDVVLDWVVNNNNNQSCKDAQRLADFACKGYSSCEDYRTEDGQGYRCLCKGYQGNPYLPLGCKAIDQCISKNPCEAYEKCVNASGRLHCESFLDDDDRTPFLPTVLSLVGFFVLLLLLVPWVYFFLKRRKLIKLREKFFRENGGLLLQQSPFRRSAGETTRIFSANELLKVTDNYSKSRIIGQGGNGTVYKGIIGDNNNQIVAIKKSRMEAKSQIEQFINDVVVVSQINHRNVVKLLGCCLETEVPLLVYEFVSNGSLYNHLHNPNLAGSLSWNIRLRIAIETASALTYLHSAASIPIIHRDVKSANILLDENFVAKVSDFGASKFIPIDETQITTLVQGTIGYLDPQYFQTSKLTQKSDVYSYGVVLIELLTGESPACFARPEPHRNLSSYFILSMQQGRLFEILEPGLANEENKEELKAVANVAMRCLRLKGEERPLMKEVLIELIELRKLEKHPLGQANYCEEALNLLNQQLGSCPTESSSSSIYSGCMPTDMAFSLDCPR